MKEIYKGSLLQQQQQEQEQQRLYVLQLLHFLRAGNLHYCKTKNRKEQNRNYMMIIQKQKKWFLFQQQIKEVKEYIHRNQKLSISGILTKKRE
jgi:hypothetical protein